MKARKQSTTNEFRVIGGLFRRRRLTFAPDTDARPTPNRVRETVFNWLAPYIEGLHIADLFAGSGALGIEALSRQAKSAVFVESDPRLVRSLKDNLSQLSCDNARVVSGRAEDWIANNTTPLDVVFLDPPFAARSHNKLCKLLDLHRSIAPGGWCYLEMAADQELNSLPETWDIVRDKRAGNVRYMLVQIAMEAPAQSI